MSIITSSIRNSNGTTYTVTTDSPSDWSSVAINTYFKNLSDGLIYYKTSTSNIVNTISSSYALSASYAPSSPAFPYTGSALITGSLGVTGSTSFMTTGSGVASPFTFTAGGTATSPYVKVVNSDAVSEVSLVATRLAGTGVLSTAVNRAFLYLSNAAGYHNVIGSNDGLAFTAFSPAGYDPAADQMRLKNGNLGIGTAYSATARLDVKAQGALSTDIAFRVRNSADTLNPFQITGDGKTKMQGSLYYAEFDPANGLYIGNNYGNALNFTGILQGTSWINNGADGKLAVGLTTANYRLDVLNSTTNPLIPMRIGTQNGENNTKVGIAFTTTWTGGVYGNVGGVLYMNHQLVGPNQAVQHCSFDFALNSLNTAPVTKASITAKSNILLGTPTENLADSHTIYIPTGSAPTSSIVDGFKLYASTGSIASNVRPHFRTSNGTIVWLGDESRLFNVTASRTIISSSQNTISGSSLTVYGSGSTQPVFTVQGSQGELFSITDSLSGSLFSVNDISGLPILEVFSDNTTLIGNYLDPMLITTAKVTQTNSGSFVLYSLPTASYDTAFFEYSVKSGSNARAGTIMAIQSGTSVNFTETTTTSFGSTSAISFTVIVTGSNMALTGSSTTGSWTIKTIVRGL